MSEKYKHSVNTNLLIADLCLFIFVLFAIISFTSFQNNEMKEWGLIVLTGFIAFASLLFFIEFAKRAFLLYNFQNGKHIISWLIKGKELEQLKSQVKDSGNFKLLGAFFISILLIIIFALVNLFIYLNDGEMDWEIFAFMMIIAFSISIFLLSVLFIKKLINNKINNKEYFIGYLGNNGIAYNHIVHKYNFNVLGIPVFKVKLNHIRLIKDKKIAYIDLKYTSYGVLYLHRKMAVEDKIPIPSEYYQVFQNAIDQLQIKESNIEAINLLDKEVSKPQLSIYIHFIISAILGICAYTILNNILVQ